MMNIPSVTRTFAMLEAGVASHVDVCWPEQTNSEPRTDDRLTGKPGLLALHCERELTSTWPHQMTLRKVSRIWSGLPVYLV